MNDCHSKFPPLKDGVLYIDNTTLAAWTSCPRSFEYAWVNRRRTIEERAALNFGSGIHVGLDIRYQLLKEDVTIPQSELENKMLTAVGKHFEETPLPADDWRNANLANDVLRAYNDYYLVEVFDVLQSEASFAVPLATFPVPWQEEPLVCMWTGRVDLTCKFPSTQANWVMDHKTTSVLGPGYANDYLISQPQTGYVWAARKRGVDVQGYIVNAIAIRKSSSKKTADDNFQRFAFDVDEDRLSDWYHNTCYNIREMLNQGAAGFYPMRTEHHCFGKYGKCQFLPICMLPRNQRDMQLAGGGYTDNVWSPLEDV